MSFETCRANALEAIHQVYTSSTILAQITKAFIYLCFTSFAGVALHADTGIITYTIETCCIILTGV